MVQLKIFSKGRKVIEFASFNKLANWITQNNKHWKFKVREFAEVKELSKIQNGKFVCKAVFEALVKKLQLVEITQPNYMGVRRIALGIGIEIEKLVENWCEDYCRHVGYRMIAISIEPQPSHKPALKKIMVKQRMPKPKFNKVNLNCNQKGK